MPVRSRARTRSQHWRELALEQIDTDVGTYYLTNGLKILTIVVAIKKITNQVSIYI